LAEKSLGHPDPGAVSFALIAGRVAEYLGPSDSSLVDSRLATSVAGHGAEA
jgi:dihydroxyacetone kinase